VLRKGLWVGLLGVLALAGWWIVLPAAVSGLKDRVASESGLSVILDAPTGFGFDPRIDGTAPKPWQVLIALGGLREAAAVYPEGVLDTYAPRVLLAGRLEILSHRVGGTLQPGWVLLATDYLGPGNGSGALARVYHHEVSSLLIASRPFPDALWRAALPDAFSYPEGDAARLAATRVHADDLEPFHADGFVSDYGVSSMENDINTYAELLLSDPGRLAALAIEYPAIARKARLVRDYYEALHPDFAARLAENGG